MKRAGWLLVILTVSCSESKPQDPHMQNLLGSDPAKARAALEVLARRQGFALSAITGFASEGVVASSGRLTAAQVGNRVLVVINHGKAVRLVLIDLNGVIVDRAGVCAESGELRTQGEVTVSGAAGAWTIFEFRGESRLFRRPLTVKLEIRDGQFSITEPALSAADALLDEPYLPITSIPRDPSKGPYAGRFRKRAESRAAKALQRALEWLAREWPGRATWDIAARGHNLGVQSLGVIAFLRAGYTPVSSEEFSGLRAGDIVRSGLRVLIEAQDTEGCIADRTNQTYLNSHIMATLALCEAWAITGLPIYEGPAKRATAFLVAAQNPGAGFHDSYRSGVSDSSCTGLAFLALRAAQIAGIDVPKSCWEGMLAWVDSATGADGRTGYLGVGDRAEARETLTAAADLIRSHVGSKRRGAERILNDRPEWSPDKIDGSYWLFGVEVAPVEWKMDLERALLAGQSADGSWPWDQWAGSGAVACATALNAMTLARLINPP